MIIMKNITSRGIERIPFLNVILDNSSNDSNFRGHITAQKIIGWGAKPSGCRAEKLAAKHGLSPLFLEDGFLRSFGTGDNFPPLSLVIDDRGIYYDSTRPNALEVLLNVADNLLTDISDKIEDAHALILAHKLSKYNHAPSFDTALLRLNDTRRILVVDQTAGDHSISLGGASADTFAHMLETARTEHPGATVYVKTHPEVSSGRKGGHFSDLLENDSIVLLRDPANPLSLIEHMDHIYVVSSTMGFEALLADKPVTCFGIPWYAGWGVTDDRLPCPRRTRKRSVEELFAAGYFHYPRYLNPVTRERGTIFDMIDWLIRQKQIETRFHGEYYKGRLICIGFRRWKQANISEMLSLNPGGVMFVKDVDGARALTPRPGDHIVWWSSTPPAGAIELAEECGAAVMRMEDGFARSVGLGSDLIAPLSLVLDTRGIYFDPRQPSDLEHILSTVEFDQAELDRAAEVRAFITEHGITKYNLEPREAASWPSNGQPIILVTGQVEDDASIRFGCSQINTNGKLLKIVREANPEAFIVYKPHPDVMSGNRRGKLVRKEAEQWADYIEDRLSVISCIEASDEVHVMTSLAGFDALLRGKKVATYGQPFFAGWGLTEDHDSDGAAFLRRQRRLTLDELVAGTLLHYPLYWDPILKGYTSCEAVLHRLVETRNALEAQKGGLEKLRTGYIRRQIRKLNILAHAWLGRHLNGSRS